MPIDVTTLSNLSRPALQKLAKEYKIKANLKSEMIIHILTHSNGEDTNTTKLKQTVKGKISMSPEPLLLEGPISGTVSSPSLFQGDALHNNIQTPNSPTYALSTPESSIAETLESEAAPGLLRNTVEILAGLAASNQRTTEKIRNLRLAVKTLHEKAADMQDLLNAERAMRRRLEDFCAHWMKINPRWTYDEVWAGELHVKDMQATHEVTTSDEDDRSI
ncbi:hypothetical protein BDZ94DRAFT_1303618 [Collybia nuda]|uniref:Uncharacterized protein n=1 Tax=Collybia nuda TaxID=64659 RepID=A0A9P5YHH5_9AGAR|nr:hypothetical protein BDZ94DRAFT_1303618 [Collybia nuda]